MRFNPKHAIPGAPQRGIPPSIGSTPVGVTLDVDLHGGYYLALTDCMGKFEGELPH